MGTPFIMGVMWALIIWFVWYGYWFFGAPAWFKKWVYSSKLLMLMLDAAIVIGGGVGMTKVSGSITAGVGSAILALLCFITTILIYACKNTVKSFKQPWESYHGNNKHRYRSY